MSWHELAWAGTSSHELPWILKIPKESKWIKKNPKDSKTFPKNPKNSKKLQTIFIDFIESKRFQEFLKISKKFPKNLKNSKKIKKIQKESKRLERLHTTQNGWGIQAQKANFPPPPSPRIKELEAPQRSWLGRLKRKNTVLKLWQYGYFE